MRRAAVLVGLAVAAWVAPAAWARATVGARTTADEPQYLMTALSLAEDHDLDVSDERAGGRYRAWHEAGLPLQEEVQPDGSRVSPHDPLLPALLAIPVALGGWLAAKLFLAVLTGTLAASMLWVAAARFDVPLKVAVVTVLGFGASAPLAVYGTQVYPEIAAALAVTVAIGAIAGEPTRKTIAASAVAVMALPWLSVKYAPVAAVLATLCLCRVLRVRGFRDASVLASMLAIAAALFAVAHVAWYGGLTPYAAGRHFTAGEASVMGAGPDFVGRSTRLVGLLVDRSFGIAAWQPAYLLAVPALAALSRRRPPGWVLLVLPVAAGYLNASFAALTMHGWWFPGRQLVVVLPAMVIAVAWLAALSRIVERVVAVSAALGASVFAWLTGQALTGDLRFVVSFDRLTHPIWRISRLVLPDYRELTGIDAVLHAVWIAALLFLLASGWRGAVGRAATEEAGAPAPGKSTSRGARMKSRNVVVATLACMLLAAGCGKDDGATVRQIGGAAGSASASGTSECSPVGDSSKAHTTVNVTLDEYSVNPDPDEVVAGFVHFEAENVGKEAHEMVVVRAASAAALPVGDDMRVSEDDLTEGALVGEIEAFPAGQTCDGTFDLDPGTYVLFCNLLTGTKDKPVGHFREGMSTTFTVT